MNNDGVTCDTTQAQETHNNEKCVDEHSDVIINTSIEVTTKHMSEINITFQKYLYNSNREANSKTQETGTIEEQDEYLDVSTGTSGIFLNSEEKGNADREKKLQRILSLTLDLYLPRALEIKYHLKLNKVYHCLITVS